MNLNAQRKQGIAMLVASATCFGLNIPYAGLAGRLGLPGPDVVAIRVLFMLVVLGGYMLLNKIPLHIARADRKVVLALGLASAMVGICYVSSLSFIPVGLAAMTFYTFPLVILMLSPLVEDVRLSSMIWLACALTLGGIGLAIGPGFTHLDWRGLALAGCASLAAARSFKASLLFAKYGASWSSRALALPKRSTFCRHKASDRTEFICRSSGATVCVQTGIVTDSSSRAAS